MIEIHPISKASLLLPPHPTLATLLYLVALSHDSITLRVEAEVGGGGGEWGRGGEEQKIPQTVEAELGG